MRAASGGRVSAASTGIVEWQPAHRCPGGDAPGSDAGGGGGVGAAAAPSGLPHQGHQNVSVAPGSSPGPLPVAMGRHGSIAPVLGIWASRRSGAPDEGGPRDSVRAAPRRVLVATHDGEPSWLPGFADGRGDLEVVPLPDPAHVDPRDPACALVIPAGCGSRQEVDAAARRIEAVRARDPKRALVVVADGDAFAFAASRETLFLAGATEVVPAADPARLDELISFFSGAPEMRHVRHRLRMDATLTRGDGRVVPAAVESISNAGLQIRVALPELPAGGVFKLSLPLGHPDDPKVDVWGLVRGVAPAGGTTVARLRFIGLLGEERARIARYLDGLERETRSTDPADATAAIRRLDAVTLAAGLEADAPPPDWLAGSLPLLTHSERSALSGKVAAASGARDEGRNEDWRRVAVARIRVSALAEALERFDPVLDDEPRGLREAVTESLLSLSEAQPRADALARAGGGDDAERVVAAMDAAAVRLQRAVAARVPQIASGRPDLFDALEQPEHGSPARVLRNRLVAVGAGLVVGFAIVYTVVVMIYGPGRAP